MSSNVLEISRRRAKGNRQSEKVSKLAMAGLANVQNEDPIHLDFVLPLLLVGTVGLLVAPGGTGKSTMLLQIAANVALGKDREGFFDGAEIEPGGVAILNLEDPE